MVHQSLIQFIDTQLRNGIPKELINIKLLDKGWRQEDIDQAFTYVGLTHKVSRRQARKRFVVTTGKVLFVLILLFILFCIIVLYFHFENTRRAVTEVSLPAVVE